MLYTTWTRYGVDEKSTFVFWKKLVINKFEGVAKTKWEQRTVNDLKDFKSFFEWMVNAFDIYRCYGHWNKLIKDWRPKKGTKWRELLVVFNKYVQQYTMFAGLAKPEETPYHFIEKYKFGSIIYHAVQVSRLNQSRIKEMQKLCGRK